MPCLVAGKTWEFGFLDFIIKILNWVSIVFFQAEVLMVGTWKGKENSALSFKFLIN